MYDNILVDSNLWYTRNYSVLSDLTHQIKGRTIVTGGIWGFLNSILKWERNFAKRDTRFWFLFDNHDSKSNMRQEIIDPSYKLNRFKRPKHFYRGMDYLRLILLNKSEQYTVVYGTGYEADDIVPYILKNIPEGEKNLLISEDMDWARCISNNTHLYKNKHIIDPKEFLNTFNFSPTVNSVTLYKVIKGDSSDEIPVGVPRIQTKLVERLCNEYKDIYDVLENLEIIDYLSEGMKEKFRENESRLNLNHQLISFFPINEEEINQYIIQGKFVPRVLKVLYETLNFEVEKIDKQLYTYIQQEEAKKEKDPIKILFNQPKMKRK
jgi:hypothetical protein